MTWRFSALMTPMRDIMVGPFFSATRIKTSIAVCHSGAVCSAFGSLVMYLPASCSVRSIPPSGKAIDSSNRRAHPRSLMALALLVDPIRHPRRVLGIARIAPRAGCASTPAVAGVLAFPRLVGMVLTHPAAVLADGALHRGRVDKVHQQN